WQAHWEENQTFLTPTDRTRPKYYVLDMFPYPSGSGLHVGHPKGYVATDIVSRARRMMGYNVLRVMGWDSFGLPAERQAVKENKHPREITTRNIATFKGQLTRLGLSYDWTRELATSDQRYYRWTQWIFLKLHQQGLAYQSDLPVNWCPALGTVLSNEEVQDGKYVETGDPVEQRALSQWMFKITEYADRLLDGLENVDWPDGTRKKQQEWIGRSEGAQIRFPIVDSDDAFEAFTTRPDTLFGCTYAVLAPEHPLVAKITTDAQRAAVDAYLADVSTRSDRDRISQAADGAKTGAFTGAYCTNPVDGRAVPVWIADYVLASYGTGAVFACPAHDERDWHFAKAFDLDIIEVVSGGDVSEAAYAGDGPHVRSEFLDGLDITAAKTAIIAWLEEHGHGKGTIQYKLRDWLFSRQRYWGEPFPIIHLEDGTVKVLPESALPIALPELDDYTPVASEDGEPLPPLARATDWLQTTDPATGAPATRETNTMPQWAGSCWYYLRFISPDRDDVAWDEEEEKYWMPVDLYVGGSEHAVLHLLYARFWHMVLFDLGLVSTPEPFERLFHQGMIHAMAYNSSPDMHGKFYYPHEVEERDGQFVAKDSGEPVFTKNMKMSKSRYNVSNPDDLCEEYGADSLRLYEVFMGPLEEGGMWDDAGVAGMRRFLDRTWRLIVDPETDGPSGKIVAEPQDDAELERALHIALKKITEGVDSLRFNTAVSDMMVFVNLATRRDHISQDVIETFILMLSPFAPHVAEELWTRLGHSGSLAHAPWPAFDESKLVTKTITLAIQVNGKVRSEITLSADISKEDALATAKADEKIAGYLAKGTIRREIYVPGRLINFVVK
ncbi:MAG: leucyl-tRNA synthetase, partial [Myxococcota bacterium]